MTPVVGAEASLAVLALFEGQIPTDVVVIGGGALVALVMVLYSLGQIFGRKKRPAPQATLVAPAAAPTPAGPPLPELASAGTESQVLRSLVPKVTVKAAGDSGRAPGTGRPESGTIPPAAAVDGAGALSGSYMMLSEKGREAERERLKAEFARSAEQAAADRKAGLSSSASPSTAGGSSISARTAGAGGRGGSDVTPLPVRDRTGRFGRKEGDKVDLRSDLRLDRGATTERIDARYERGPRPVTGSGSASQSGAIGEPFYDKWKEKRIADELQEQNTELTNLLTMLPGLIKRLTETTKKREMAPLLADTIMRLCMPPPEKVMVFFLAKNKEDLILAARVGYDDAPDTSTSVIKMQKHFGRIGYALRHQLTMDAKDFERDGIEDDTPPGQAWHVEIASPLVFNKEVLGAISVEGFAAYNKNAKRLVGIAANLGALAISLAEKTAQIQHQANSDALTGLYNKRYFFERLEQEVEKARETGRPLSIFMFDIDHFKKYNDRNGHPAGDEALKITGHLLNERKRETDTAARYGGEEFIVILPDTPKEGGYIFAESYRKIVESYPYPHGEGQPLGRVSISGGVSTFPEDGQSPTSLIEAADECLYRSKEHGRNHVTKRMPKEQMGPAAVPK